MHLTFHYDPKVFGEIADAVQASLQKAADATIKEVAEESVREGRADIAASGRFGARWQEGLRYKLYDNDPKNKSVSAVALIYHERPMAGVFQHGALIRGKPLLWLPTQNAGGTHSPRNYSGRLVSVNVPGKAPMLFDAQQRKPVFVGVRQVTLRKRWHIIEIVQRIAGRLVSIFTRNLKS